MNLETVRHAYLRRVIAPMLRAMGVRATTRLATAIARGVHRLNTPGGQLARRRIIAAASARSIAPDEMVEQMYEHIARFWVEVLFTRRLMRPDRWEAMFDVAGRDQLERLATSRRGCLLATGYYGSLTMGVFALGQIFRPIHVVADTALQPGLAAWQRDLSRIDGVKIVDRAGASREIPAILQRGGAMLMVCEPSRRRGRGVPARFLGAEIQAYPTLERLARWYDVPVAVVTCRREPQPMRFALAWHSTHEWREGLREGDLTRAILSSLDRAVWTDPAQYLWSVQSDVTGRNAGELNKASNARERALDATERLRDPLVVRA